MRDLNSSGWIGRTLLPKGLRFAKAGGREGESSAGEANAGVESKNAEDAAAVCRKLRRDGTICEEIFAGMVKKRLGHGVVGCQGKAGTACRAPTMGRSTAKIGCATKNAVAKEKGGEKQNLLAQTSG